MADLQIVPRWCSDWSERVVDEVLLAAVGEADDFRKAEITIGDGRLFRTHSGHTPRVAARSGVMRAKVLKALGRGGMTAVAVLSLAVLVAAFGPLPGFLLDFSAAAGQLQPAERIRAETDIRTALIQSVGGVLLVIGAVTAWRQMLIARAQQQVGWRTAVTDAFSKAVDQLGSTESVSLRLGGIYSLDRIADDDPAEGPRVAEILSAFVRETATVESVSRDVMAALVVLTSRDWPQRVDLSGSRLAGVQLPKARLTKARLVDVDLRSAVLTDAVLRSADLSGCDLRKADIRGVDLWEATLAGAQLSGARADSATRWPVDFVPAGHGILLA